MVADGWFHASMYAVAAFGLWRLWRMWAALDTAGTDRALAAWSLIGFGAWHLLDAVGSHWLLGIHRIRMDVGNPLARDLAWAAVFGLASLALVLWLCGCGGGPGGSRATAALLAQAPSGRVSGPRRRPWAALLPPWPLPPAYHPPRPSPPRPPPARGCFGPTRRLVVVASLRPRAAARLYQRGALFGGGVGLPAGCLSSTREG